MAAVEDGEGDQPGINVGVEMMDRQTPPTPLLEQAYGSCTTPPHPLTHAHLLCAMINQNLFVANQAADGGLSGMPLVSSVSYVYIYVAWHTQQHGQ
jgi:hypothetical protein